MRNLVLLFAFFSGPAFATALDEAPKEAFIWSYEVSTTCKYTFCAPQYSGAKVSLNCRDSASNGSATFQLIRSDIRDGLKVRASVPGQNEPVDMIPTAQGTASFSQNHSEGGGADVSIEFKEGRSALFSSHYVQERHDPYLGWYAADSRFCRGVATAPAKEEFPPPAPTKSWREALPEGTLNHFAVLKFTADIERLCKGKESYRTEDRSIVVDLKGDRDNPIITQLSPRGTTPTTISDAGTFYDGTFVWENEPGWIRRGCVLVWNGVSRRRLPRHRQIPIRATNGVAGKSEVTVRFRRLRRRVDSSPAAPNKIAPPEWRSCMRYRRRHDVFVLSGSRCWRRRPRD